MGTTPKKRVSPFELRSRSSAHRDPGAAPGHVAAQVQGQSRLILALRPAGFGMRDHAGEHEQVFVAKLLARHVCNFLKMGPSELPGRGPQGLKGILCLGEDRSSAFGRSIARPRRINEEAMHVRTHGRFEFWRRTGLLLAPLIDTSFHESLQNFRTHSLDAFGTFRVWLVSASA